ncbi:MAG: hypothetical protein WCA63_00865, partial [Gallionella sp.]
MISSNNRDLIWHYLSDHQHLKAPKLIFWNVRRAQPIDATHALNLSAGVSYAKVLRGRSFNCRATAFSFA